VDLSSSISFVLYASNHCLKSNLKHVACILEAIIHSCGPQCAIVILLHVNCGICLSAPLCSKALLAGLMALRDGAVAESSILQP
jgi:hypothetical protein